MPKKGKEVDPLAAGKQRRPAAKEFALLPKIFYTSTAQEKSMQNRYEAQLEKIAAEIAAQVAAGRTPKYTAHARVKRQIRVFRRASNYTSWHWQGPATDEPPLTELDTELDAAVPPRQLGCTYRLRRDWARFLDSQAHSQARAELIFLTVNRRACHIAFAMGCSGFRHGLRALPPELMKKICSFAFSTPIEVAFHPTVGTEIGEIAAYAVLKVGSRTVELITDEEKYADL